MPVTASFAPPISTMPGPTIVPLRMFIGGEPMKVATNFEAGRR